MGLIDLELTDVYKIIDVNTKIIENSIIPLFHGYKGSRPVFFGSAVYILIENRYFIFTAKHIVDEAKDNIIIPMDSNEFNSLPVSVFNCADSKDIDIAVAELDKPLKLFSPLLFKDIMNIDLAKSIPNKLIALGFPETRVKATSIDAKGELKKLLTDESNLLEYKRMKVDPRIGIIIDFDKTSVFSQKKVNVLFPKPNGMSGGGLFGMYKNGLLEINIAVLLVGILTDWDDKTKKGMKATKIKFALAILKSKYGIEIPDRFINDIIIGTSK